MDKHTVYLIINGPLGMSAGKIAAQTFQACERMMQAGDASPEIAERIAAWRATHTKTIVKIAKTPDVFARACRELDGVLMVDEGRNEVEPGSATVFATYPINREGEQPKILAHKKIPMFVGEKDVVA